MYTIYDYLKYYKNVSLEELPWNGMDNLFAAILSYAPFPSFSKKNWMEFVKEVLNFSNPEKDIMISAVLKLISILKDSTRYQELKFYNFINYKDNTTQFGALTMKVRGVKIISFKGTDGSVIGWLENFRLCYTYPTNTQNLAIKYLNQAITLIDSNVYVVGHSKGGNLAMASAMELSSYKFQKIKQIYNFDGPGFRKQEFESFKYQRLASKLTNIIPTGSYIGTLLYNKNYQVVSSSSYAINEHYPTFWNTYGTMFIEGKLSSLSNELIKRTTIGLSKLEEQKVKEIFETAFQVFNQRETLKLKLTLRDIMRLLKSVYDMDKELSSYIATIVKTMLILSNKKEIDKN